MSLISGRDLANTRQFFSAGTPPVNGTSVDLTIGRIFDHEGEEWIRPYILKPGQMVQVVSKEAFALPDTITGHVTYKTALTRQGVWALTVGIVDPGWKGPISTTLLNFSNVNHSIARETVFSGSVFLSIILCLNPQFQPVHRWKR